jgi:hypothetical protein
MKAMRNASRILFGKPGGKRLLGRPCSIGRMIILK